MSDNSKTRYLALSIGPIYATIQQARKTRELWAASYLFSKLMELLIEELKSKVDILSPIKAGMTGKPLYGAGIFPDRLFAVANKLDVEELITAKDEAISKLSKIVLPKDVQHTSQTLDFWKKYLRIVHVFKDIDPAKDNVLLKMNEYLDTLELQPAYFEVEPEIDFLNNLLESPYKTDFVKELIDRGSYKGLISDKGLFPSTADIATIELFQKNGTAYNNLRASVIKEEEDNEDNLEGFYEELFSSNAGELGSKAEDYHKYFCIVHVDGDSFGKVIEKLIDNAAIKKFSGELAKYASEAARIINKFGGKPVYIGGDDLVFFTPVRSAQGTVFELIQELDEEFNESGKYDFNPKPTLSFGVTISYYKYPLFEAQSLSYEQLFDRAKKFKRANGIGKDAIAFRFLKHSGSYFEGIIGKEDLKYLTGFSSAHEAIPEMLLSSVMYKLDSLKGVVSAMVESDKLDRLDNLFENYFNEAVHKNAEKQLNTVKLLMEQLLSQKLSVDGEPLDLQENLYGVLRVLDFLTIKTKSHEPIAG